MQRKDSTWLLKCTFESRCLLRIAHYSSMFVNLLSEHKKSKTCPKAGARNTEKLGMHAYEVLKMVCTSFREWMCVPKLLSNNLDQNCEYGQ